MNSKPEYQKYKQASLTDGQLIGAQTYFSFRLYIADGEWKTAMIRR